MIELINQALAAIGANAIVSLDENSREARVAGIHYDPCRRELLRRHPWNFATRVAALAPTGTPPSPWACQYAMPADCLRVRHLVSSFVPPPSAFALGRDQERDVLWSDLEGATLCYSGDVQGPFRDPLFVQALVARLALAFLMPVTGEAKQLPYFNRAYQEALQAAMVADGNEEMVTPARTDPDWIQVRR